MWLWNQIVMFAFKLLILTLLIFDFSFCCRDWKMKTVKITNCPKLRSRIKIINASLYFDDKCDLKASSCIDIQSYSTSILQITSKNNQIIVFDQKVELCNEKQNLNEIIQMVLDVLGLNSTSQCTVKTSNVFCQTKQRVLKYTKSLQMMLSLLEGAGKVSNSKIMFHHDTGESCIDVVHEIIQQ
ncbi:hypothetical protein ACKWTF_001975 [Chironomus riparius]